MPPPTPAYWKHKLPTLKKKVVRKPLFWDLAKERAHHVPTSGFGDAPQPLHREAYEGDSIFGPTYDGVENPNIPFEHAYPTRYHGLMPQRPEYSLPYREDPFAVVPFTGIGQDGGGLSPTTQAIWGVAATASMAAGVYHGYKRNNSVGWGLWWGLMGAMFPVVVPALAIAQGYGRKRETR